MKSHRVAHENQRRGGFCYYHYTTFIATVKIPFLKKEYKLPLFLAVHTYYMQCNRYVLCCQLSINQFVQHNFFSFISSCTFRINGMPFSHQRCIRIASPVCSIVSGSRLCHCLLNYHKLQIDSGVNGAYLRRQIFMTHCESFLAAYK